MNNKRGNNFWMIKAILVVTILIIVSLLMGETRLHESRFREGKKISHLKRIASSNGENKEDEKRAVCRHAGGRALNVQGSLEH